MRKFLLLALFSTLTVFGSARSGAAGCLGRASRSSCCTPVDVWWSGDWIVDEGPYIIIAENPLNGGGGPRFDLQPPNRGGERPRDEDPVNGDGERSIDEDPVNGGRERTIDEDPVSYRPGAVRTWLYGASPKLVIGTLLGMEAGNVHIANRESGVATIPMEQLSRIDQKIVATQLAVGNRTWTDRTRRYQRTAEFVRVEGQSVILKTNAGKAINVAFAKLSPADQCVVRHLSGTPIVEEVLTLPPTANLAARLK